MHSVSMALSIKELQEAAHAMARRQGWHEGSRSVELMLQQIDADLRQALAQAGPDRDLRQLNTDVGNDDELPSELADIVIRIADIAEYLDIDLETVVENRLRRMR